MPDNPYAVSASMDSASSVTNIEEGCCPLCGLDKHMAKSKPLYDTPVCKKCYYAFANRRQLAYIIDNILFRLAMIPLVMIPSMIVAQTGSTNDTTEVMLDLIPYLILPLFAIKDGFAGYSLGKLICGVRLINGKTGVPGGFLMSFLRNLPIFIPIVPLIIAFQLQKGKRWGDGWSSSKVIWMKHKDHAIFAPDRSGMAS